MAAIDPALADPTPTGAVADRVFVYRVAARLLREADLPTDTEPHDVLRLAEFLAGEDM